MLLEKINKIRAYKKLMELYKNNASNSRGKPELQIIEC